MASSVKMQPIYSPKATLVIHGAAEMSKRERLGLAEWLYSQATDLIKDGHKYSKRFRASYMKRIG